MTVEEWSVPVTVYTVTDETGDESATVVQLPQEEAFCLRCGNADCHHIEEVVAFLGEES